MQRGENGVARSTLLRQLSVRRQPFARRQIHLRQLQPLLSATYILLLPVEGAKKLPNEVAKPLRNYGKPFFPVFLMPGHDCSRDGHVDLHTSKSVPSFDDPRWIKVDPQGNMGRGAQFTLVWGWITTITHCNPVVTTFGALPMHMDVAADPPFRPSECVEAV